MTLLEMAAPVSDTHLDVYKRQVPDRRDVEHPVVLYEYQPNWRTKKRRRNFCRRVHRILTEHGRENGSIKRAC